MTIGQVPEPSSTGHAPGIGAAIKERIGWHALSYKIPPVATRLPYMLGGLTFIGIMILIGTGILLDQFYNPSPIGAHDSIVYIMTRVRLGNWIRGLHYWAATLVFISVSAHLVYVFWRRSYQRPRELTWLAGVGLLTLIFGLIFTGTVLRGDQEGGEALAHAVAGARMLKGVGVIMTQEFAPSTALLTRMHNLHVSVLPILLIALIGAHFTLIRVLGIHSHEPPTAVFTDHLRRLTGFGLLLFAMLGTVALLAPPSIGHPAIQGVEVTKPFWPFLWIYAAENAIGLVGMLLAPVVVFGFLFLVPLIWGRRHEDRHSRSLLVIAVLIAGLYIGGILYGVFAERQQHIGM